MVGKNVQVFCGGEGAVKIFLGHTRLRFRRILDESLARATGRYSCGVIFLASFKVQRARAVCSLCRGGIISFTPVRRFSTVVITLSACSAPDFQVGLVRNLGGETRNPIVDFHRTSRKFCKVLSSTGSVIRRLMGRVTGARSIEGVYFVTKCGKRCSDRVQRRRCQLTVRRLKLPICRGSVFCKSV